MRTLVLIYYSIVYFGLYAQTSSLLLLNEHNDIRYTIYEKEKIRCITKDKSTRGRLIILNDSTICLKNDTIPLSRIKQVGIKTPGSITCATLLNVGGVFIGFLGVGSIIDEGGNSPLGFALTGYSTLLFVLADRCLYNEKEIAKYSYHLKIQ